MAMTESRRFVVGEKALARIIVEPTSSDNHLSERFVKTLGPLNEKKYRGALWYEVGFQMRGHP